VLIVIFVSVTMALVLALVDRQFLAPYSTPAGQVVLAFIVGLYAAGILWLRRLARFESPQRMLGDPVPAAGTGGQP
jgi:Flp pilus assembly protein TadB